MLAQSLRRQCQLLLTNPSYFWPLASLVIAGDAILTQLVIRFVPYTEIDWETYMTHIDIYVKGQRDYGAISGPTGPLVYPAGHVYIHHLLYSLTDSGTNRALLQQIYALLSLLSLTLSCAIYRQAGGFPNWLIMCLPLSKRLHSIFVLRFFNDCWMLVAAQAAVLSYQLGLDLLGTLAFSVAVSVKMSALLYVPGLLVILFKARGLAHTVRQLLIILGTQVVFALVFLRNQPWSYLRLAFDFSRAFLYKWTVNWRFISEETFLNRKWATSLLVCHISTLVAFGLFKWCRKDGVWRVLYRGTRRPTLPAGVGPVTSDYIATVLFTSNLIGIVFARSLHYQFYSWYAQQIPFLAWRTRFHLLIKIAIMLSIEYAWNVFPSTPLSSLVLFAANVILLAGIWFGFPEGRALCI